MDRGREIVAVNGVNSNGKSCPGAGEVNEGAGGVCGGGHVVFHRPLPVAGGYK